MLHLPSYQQKETGMVSIVVTIIIMLVLSVTVMSFAAVMRREQRQVLDRQLNTQAFYAAESGINDAIAKLQELSLNDPSNVLGSSYTNGCKDFDNAIAAAGSPHFQPNVDPSDPNVAYSCLLLDPKPPTLEYKSVDRNPIVVPIKSGSGTLDTIIFNWQASDGTPDFNCPGGALSSGFSPNTQWVCKTGLLRVDIVNTPATFDRNTLNNNLRTLFLYPRPGGTGSVSLNPLPATTGQIVNGNCTNPPPPNTKYCTVRVSVPPAQSYYLKISSIYQPSSLTLSALSSGSSVSLVGAQAMIDATGRASDILRRMQVRVSINPLGDGPFPIGAIESVNTLCKQFSVIPTNPPKSVSTGSDPECALN